MAVPIVLQSRNSMNKIPVLLLLATCLSCAGWFLFAPLSAWAASSHEETQTIVKESQDGSKPAFPSSISYDEGGYSGTLSRADVDYEPLYQQRTHVISRRELFNDLPSKDMSALPQQKSFSVPGAADDGSCELRLSNVSFSVQKRSSSGVPVKYRAYAIYSGEVTVQTCSGYRGVATYRGTVYGDEEGSSSGDGAPGILASAPVEVSAPRKFDASGSDEELASIDGTPMGQGESADAEGENGENAPGDSAGSNGALGATGVAGSGLGVTSGITPITQDSSVPQPQSEPPQTHHTLSLALGAGIILLVLLGACGYIVQRRKRLNALRERIRLS